MSTVRDFLKAMCTRHATHAAAMGKSFGEMAKHHRALAEAHAENGDISDAHAQLADQYEECTKACTAFGEDHSTMARDIQKSAADDLSKTVPDNVRGIIPTDAPLAVPRFGQPAMPGPISTSGLSELALEKILGASDLARFD